jgi:hypothetical protein
MGLTLTEENSGTFKQKLIYVSMAMVEAKLRFEQMKLEVFFWNAL